MDYDSFHPYLIANMIGYNFEDYPYHELAKVYFNTDNPTPSQYKESKILTFKHNHGSIDVQTYRIGNFAYSTDLKLFYEKDIEKLKNLDLWIVGMLRSDSHPSHAGFKEIIEYIKYIKPKKTILTHMTALLDEKELKSRCPKNVLPAYDGMEIKI